MQIRKATTAEKAAYQPTAIYPLYGFIKIDGLPCPIEDLRGSWSKPDPIYEVMAPTGYHFDADETHTLLCVDLQDVRVRCGMNNLERCGENC